MQEYKNYLNYSIKTLIDTIDTLDERNKTQEEKYQRIRRRLTIEKEENIALREDIKHLRASYEKLQEQLDACRGLQFNYE